MRNQKGAAGVLLLVWLFVWVLGIVGWIANIVQIVGRIDDPITGLFILKCVGVLAAPLGSVLGIVGMF